MEKVQDSNQGASIDAAASKINLLFEYMQTTTTTINLSIHAPTNEKLQSSQIPTKGHHKSLW
jgi:hypothetical protein